MITRRSPVIRLVACAGALAALSTRAEPQRPKAGGPALTAAYTVEVRAAQRMFHVTAAFGHVASADFELALPVWTPGVYDTKSYAQNIRKLTVHDGAGLPLRVAKSAPSAWRIASRGHATVVVEFDYLATDLSWNGAAVTASHAVFTGTQLFLEPVGHRGIPSTVHYVVPPGWQVVSALKPTADSTTFTASSYDDLVDAPTVLGSVAVTRFEVDGREHVIARVPASAQYADVAALVDSLRPVILEERRIFGSLPYDRYVFFGVDSMDGGAVEHAGSFLAPGLDVMNAAHELFHAWNVKRIRPAEMWPYDYSRVRPGPSLWVAEGITSYYAPLIAYRAGFSRFADAPHDGTADSSRVAGDAERELLGELSHRIATFEGEPERRFVSPSDASISDGLGYGSVRPSYYTSGEILGVLLDISLLNDTRGKRRLDDVMRTLYARFYAKGRGYTAQDLVSVVSEVAGRRYDAFFDRYVTGTEDFPVDSVFALAGYHVTRSTRTLGFIPGVRTAPSTPEGHRVRFMAGAQSVAARAGIVPGDVIVAVDGIPIHQVQLANLYGGNWLGGRFVGRAGERVVLRIVHDGTARDVPITLGRMSERVVRIESDTSPTVQQLAVRTAWLQGRHQER